MAAWLPRRAAKRLRWALMRHKAATRVDATRRHLRALAQRCSQGGEEAAASFEEAVLFVELLGIEIWVEEELLRGRPPGRRFEPAFIYEL